MTETAPRIRWFAVTEGRRIPATKNLRGTWGWDATCSCGWDSRTGGAVLRYVREQVSLHKLLNH